MKTGAVAECPGKVILLGEHSVVYGRPAIAASIGRRLRVSVTRAATPARSEGIREEAVASAARSFEIDPKALAVEVRSDLPVACGLGSSAAFSVALVRALADLVEAPLGAAELTARAAEVENVFHGKASGLDVAAVANGGIVWFQKPEVTQLLSPAEVDVVVALSGEVRSTAGPVGRLRERSAAAPEVYGKLFDVAADLVRDGRGALEAGDWPRLGALMDAAHGLLNGFGVSTPVLERMVACARSAGAFGAKLTGAGGGGAIIALAPGRDAEVRGALEREGWTAFVTRIGESAAQACTAPRAGLMEESEDGIRSRRTG